MNLFVTGSDTGVGKTYVTSLLLRALRKNKVDAVGMKPIETGGGEDAQHLHEAAGGSVLLQEINPVRLKAPLAPAVAAEIEGRSIPMEKIFASYRRLSAAYPAVLVEGAGGWRVPIAVGYDMADLAADLAGIAPLQVLVVALNRLGAINHTLLTIESIRACGLACAGFVLNDGPQPRAKENLSLCTNAQWISKSSQVPLWFEIHAGQSALPPGSAFAGDWCPEPGLALAPCRVPQK